MISVSWLVKHECAWSLSLTAQPNGKCTEVLECSNERLRVRLKAPPVEGKANKVLLAWLAEIFGVRQNQLELVAGLTNRQKRVLIPLSVGDAPSIIAKLMAQSLS